MTHQEMKGGEVRAHGVAPRRSLSVAEVADLPVTVDVVTAGRCFDLGRDTSYRLARAGEFPCAVLRLGRRLVVTKAALCAALGIEP